jgi:hypothetical protein
LTERVIAIFLKGASEPLWVTTDSDVPQVGDSVGLEHADGSLTAYEVLHRMWVTAKQGEHSFGTVRLTVKPSL